MTTPNLPALLEAFFSDRLVRQRRASPNTVEGYRDTFRLLLYFVRDRLKREPSMLSLEDLEAPLIGAFLEHLEKDRGNTPRSRNVRLAAIHSFFRYAALEQPASSAVIQRVLAMPSKRYDRRPIDFLTRPEMDALLAAPNLGTWLGQRDHALLLVALQTGLRVSELTGLCCQDIVLGTGAHVRCRGKGRKERCTPLRKEAVLVLQRWLHKRAGAPSDPAFPSSRGGSLSRDAVEDLLAKHVAAARKQCPSLKTKRVSPHVLRHAVAMDLLQRGIDRSVIALWLGHESIDTTQIYLDASLELKEKALASAAPFKVHRGRYRPTDRVLEFLKSL
jgi:site-specific recombinase XerD